MQFFCIIVDHFVKLGPVANKGGCFNCHLVQLQNTTIRKRFGLSFLYNHGHDVFEQVLSVYCFSSRKSLTPVKVTSPTASDDDFLILEDDGPVWFSIPSKAATSKKHIRTSSRDKDRSADQGAKGSLPGTAPKQAPTDQADGKLEPQTVSQREKKKGRNKIKGSEETEDTVHGNKADEMLIPEDGSWSDVKEPPKPSQRKRPREVPSIDNEAAAEQPQTTGRGASEGRGKPADKKESRNKNSKPMKTLKDDCEVKKRKLSKATRKVGQDMVPEAALTQVCVGYAGSGGILLHTLDLLLSECCQNVTKQMNVFFPFFTHRKENCQFGSSD